MALSNNTSKIHDILETINNLPTAPSGNKNITASTSTQTDIDVADYATVSVAPTPSESKSTTTNGDVTPSSGKLLSKVTVNVPTGVARTSSDLTASGATVTVPAGLYSSQATKSIANGSVTVNIPTINTSTGVVTASASVNAGYVSGTPTSKTLSLTTQGAKTIMPGTSSQTAVAAQRYTTGAITVAGDSNLIAENIKKDISIFGVTGTHEGGSGGDLPNAEDYTFGDVLVMPVKGDIIIMNLDGTDRQYRVLKVNDSVAEVMAMYETPNSIAFNANLECCFVAGTQVLMADGTTKNIEDINIGDEVISYNQDTGENYTAIVDRTIIHENTTDLATITLEDGKEITMNAYHPILTEQGWHSITNYNNFDTLVIGDNVKTLEGYSPIININRYNSAPIITYNIDVKDIDEDPDIDINDNYYANSVVAHNARC